MFFYPEKEKEAAPGLGLPKYASAPSAVRFGREKRAAASVVKIPLAKIAPNPSQPRRFFEPDAIAALADSIRRYGIIQPLTVRPLADGKYELIAGERRLRAASLLGMTDVPCVLLEASEEESAALAIIENLQRENLNMFEQASAISSLIRIYSLTQDEIAARLSVSQSFVANKLRLLRYLPDEREMILGASLTERHARALLRLSGDDRLTALREVVSRRLNVAETEAYVESLLRPAADQSPAPAPRLASPRGPVLRDVRLFVNSVNHALDIMRQSGIDATSTKRDTGDATEILIRIPKEAASAVSRET